MQQEDTKFLEDSFKQYYFEHFDLIKAPDHTHEREFGFQKFNSGMIRHISIKDDKELHLLFMQNVPSDVYCSNARYSFPNLSMNEKDWKEADLIFDIDAKDLNLSCRQNHTVSICNECRNVSTNFEKCLKCNSTQIQKKSLSCKNCIDSTKIEVSKLSEILVNDLAVSQENIHVYFSGNEGFHIYVYDSQFQQVGSRERSELVDYIMFNGIIPETLGMRKFKPNRNLFPNLDEKGWRGRFAKEIFGSKSKRSKIVSELLTNDYSSFQKTLDDISTKIGVKVDPNVTMDIHRIFRLPGSINSKSGLTKLYCRDLTKFDPFTEAVFLNDESVEVVANCPTEFRLKNKKFGPFANEKATVPTYAAAYMICKNLSTIA
ncbi:MAG: DNA primase small subunit domain-containing protein [Nitrosopumilus sp.]